jgi:hypothetical protein
MEWPAEVLPATRFSARLIGYGAGCYRTAELRIPTTVDQSAVTFEPYWLVDESDPGMYCARVDAALRVAADDLIDIGFFDTRQEVEGLPAEFPRTYEMRAAAPVYAQGAAAETLPIRTFGSVTVRTDAALTPPINVGGNTYLYRDELGCTRALPGIFFPGYVVENPPADTTQTYGFVRGTLYAPAQPLCGETRVLRVVTWN